MNSRNFLNIGLALALAGLTVLAIYEPGKEKPISQLLLTSLKPAEIQKVVIEQATQNILTEKPILKTIVLTKTNDQWQMSQPYKNGANALRINKFLELSRTRSHSQYSVADINLQQLKLSAPDLIISLNDTKLLFGTTDALKGYRYVQINNTVHLITDRFSHLVRGQATSLLSPALLPKNTTITKLVLPKMALQIRGTSWQSKPENNSVSADQLQQLVDEWRFARAQRVSKMTVNNDNTRSIIEIHNDINQRILYNLTQTKDEIILARTDIGLRYHFAAETGKRLLNPQPDKSGLSASN
jgi:hypothetical protein